MSHLFDITDLLLWIFMWAAGGFLILVNSIRAQRHEYVLLGLGLGLILQTWLSNALGYFVAVTTAYWLAAGILFLLGILLTTLRKSWKEASEALHFPPGQWLVFFVLLYGFFIIGRGLAIFDDYQNLPVTSFLAAGSLPLQFPLNPGISFDYHYLLLLNASQWMHIAGMQPWTALDLSRAIFFALAIIYAGLLGQRITRSQVGAWLTGFFVAFAGGLRWILLFLPGRVLNALSTQVNMIGSGLATDPSLKLALSKIWAIEGGGPISFPFAYGNGFQSVSVMKHDGTGLMGLAIALLILLFFNKWKNKAGLLLIGALISAQAMIDEIWFVFFVAATAIILIYLIFRPGKYSRKELWWMFGIMVLVPIVVAAIQGGVLTGAVRGWLGELSRSTEASSGGRYFSLGFHLRWPPAFISAHLGTLALTNWGQALAALAEIGPIFLLLPLFVSWGKKGLRAGQLIYPILALAAIFSFLTIFLEYQGSAGISATKRLTLFSAAILTLFAVPLMWYWLRRRSQTLRFVVIGTMAAVCLGGLSYFAIESTAAQVPQESYFLDGLDAKMETQYWNNLPADVMVFDLIPSRAATMFARPLKSNLTWYETTSEYQALASHPEPVAIAQAGYDYFYLGSGEWDDFSMPVQAGFNDPCVMLVHEETNSKGEFRRLLDISGCK